MSLTKRGSGWEWFQSWYILLTLPFGVSSFLAFWYIGYRAGKLKWFIAGLVYLLGFSAFMYVAVNYPNEAPTPAPAWADPVAFGGWGLSWGIAFIHALLVRKEYVLHLDARVEQGLVKDDRMKTEIQAQYGLAGNRVDEMLVEFKENDVSVKLCRALFGVVPFAPDFQFYFNIDGAVKRVTGGADPALSERVQKLAARDEFASALKVVKALDAIDSGLGIFTGVKNVYDHMKDKDRKRTFEADPQQAGDAAVKLLGISYIIATVFPGGISEKVSGFLSTKAGKELAVYYASVELALPFADNLVSGGADLLDKIISQHQGDMESRFSQFAGGTPLADATPILMQLKDQMSGLLAQVKTYVGPLTEKLQSFAPQAMNVADSATGAMATAIDLLPTYRFLGARLVAEAAVLRAQRGEG